MNGFPGARRHGRARARHVVGKMNKMEKAYANVLETRKRDGLIRDFKFEALKLRLADLTFVTFDYLVIAADDVLELHEVKGFWEDDARVKVKVAAEQFPWFRFLGITRRRGEWLTEEIGPEEDATPACQPLSLALEG
jgi:hypothetical protein